MKLYKLTDQQFRTRAGHSNVTTWGANVTHTAKGKHPIPCTDGVIHAYTSLLLATLLNPAHANLRNPICWECEGTPVTIKPDKVGCKTLTTISQCKLPEVTTTQRVAFAILVTKAVYKSSKFRTWADNWLSGKDRTDAAANAANAAANAAATNAATAAAYAATAAAATATTAAAYAAAATTAAAAATANAATAAANNVATAAAYADNAATATAAAAAAKAAYNAAYAAANAAANAAAYAANAADATNAAATLEVFAQQALTY